LIMEKSFKSKAVIVTLDEPKPVMKKALFRVESGTIRPEALKFPAGAPVDGLTTCPSSA